MQLYFSVQRLLLFKPLTFFTSHSGPGKDGKGVDGSIVWCATLQRDRHLHFEEPRWSFPVAGWPHCHDTEHVLLSLQESLWGPNQHLGEQAQDDSSTNTCTQDRVLSVIVIHGRMFCWCPLLVSAGCARGMVDVPAVLVVPWAYLQLWWYQPAAASGRKKIPANGEYVEESHEKCL